MGVACWRVGLATDCMSKKLWIVVVAAVLVLGAASPLYITVNNGTATGTFKVTGNETNTGWVNLASALTNFGNVVLTKNAALVIGPSGGSITNVLTASANLDFPSVVASQSTNMAITVTGCGTNDAVELGVPAVVMITNTFYQAFPSNDTVWVRFLNNDATTAQNPGPAVFKVKVTKF